MHIGVPITKRFHNNTRNTNSMHTKIWCILVIQQLILNFTTEIRTGIWVPKNPSCHILTHFLKIHPIHPPRGATIASARVMGRDVGGGAPGVYGDFWEISGNFWEISRNCGVCLKSLIWCCIPVQLYTGTRFMHLCIQCSGKTKFWYTVSSKIVLRSWWFHLYNV